MQANEEKTHKYISKFGIINGTVNALDAEPQHIREPKMAIDVITIVK